MLLLKLLNFKKRCQLLEIYKIPYSQLVISTIKLFWRLTHIIFHPFSRFKAYHVGSESFLNSRWVKLMMKNNLKLSLLCVVKVIKFQLILSFCYRIRFPLNEKLVMQKWKAAKSHWLRGNFHSLALKALEQRQLTRQESSYDGADNDGDGIDSISKLVNLSAMSRTTFLICCTPFTQKSESFHHHNRFPTITALETVMKGGATCYMWNSN